MIHLCYHYLVINRYIISKIFPSQHYMNIIIYIFGIIFILFITLVVQKVRLPAKVKKAEEYFLNNDYQKACDILKKILERNTNYIPARYLRIQLLMEQNQYLLAISELNGILQTVNNEIIIIGV